jgi:putative component of membrane protein insertase Oxa1/YidC/SpoIIIJ protein YidD
MSRSLFSTMLSILRCHPLVDGGEYMSQFRLETGGRDTYFALEQSLECASLPFAYSLR